MDGFENFIKVTVFVAYGGYLYRKRGLYMTLKEKIAELSRELRPICIAKNRNLASEINSALMKHLDEHPEDRRAWFGHHKE